MKNNESGQIIVVLAIALVAILGITALAMDGGMIYQERRDDQSTADSSALAAAQKASTSATCVAAQAQAISTAQSYASTQEGVTLANDGISPSRVEATCSGDNKTLTIKVVVTSNTKTTFAKMVSRKQLQTKVEATSLVTFGGSSYADGAGMVTTDTAACSDSGGIKVGQGADCFVETVGGGIHSNNCITVEGSSYVVAYGSKTDYVSALTLGWSARALNDTNPGATPSSTIINWNVSVPGGTTLQNGQPVNVRATKTTTSIPMAGLIITPPTDASLLALCSPTVLDALVINSVGKTIPAGNYTYKSITANGPTTFGAGVYCIEDGGSVNLGSYAMTANNTLFYFKGSGSFNKNSNNPLTMNDSFVFIKNGNFFVGGSSSITAQNITIYIRKGSFILDGNTPAIMTAPSCTSSPCTLKSGIKGVLILMDLNNTLDNSNKINGFASGQIWINGSSSLNMEGTISAPGSKVYVSGNTSLVQTLKAQIVAKRIEVTGSSKIRLDTTNANLYTVGGAGSIELLK